MEYSILHMNSVTYAKKIAEDIHAWSLTFLLKTLRLEIEDVLTFLCYWPSKMCSKVSLGCHILTIKVVALTKHVHNLCLKHDYSYRHFYLLRHYEAWVVRQYIF